MKNINTSLLYNGLAMLSSIVLVVESQQSRVGIETCITERNYEFKPNHDNIRSSKFYLFWCLLWSSGCVNKTPFWEIAHAVTFGAVSNHLIQLLTERGNAHVSNTNTYQLPLLSNTSQIDEIRGKS